MSDDHSRILMREMGYSRTEFVAVLPSAMRDWTVRGGPDTWQVSTADATPVAKIRIERRPDRKMGALRLPVLAVTIDLSRAHGELGAEFLRRFERGFHRGGG